MENEQLILASMLGNREVMRQLASELSPETFIGERHKTIFRILRELNSHRLEYDLEVFEQFGRNRDYGGRKYLVDLGAAYPEPPKNLQYHVDKLRVDALKAALRVGALQRLVDSAEDPAVSLDEMQGVIQELNRELASFATAGMSSGFNLYEQYLNDMKARLRSSVFIPTGFDWLDESLIEGMARGKVSVWTARPSMGKSTFMWNLADRVANRVKKKVIYFPIEMGTISVLDGMVSLRTGIPLDYLIKTPQLLKSEDKKLINQTALSLTENENLCFWNKSIKLESLYRVISQGGYAVAIFDLWERMVYHKDQGVIAAQLEAMQQLSKDTDCHFALVHQTRRGVETRKDKRPTLEDLKNSGGYEEVADLVVAFYRDCYYNLDVAEDVIEVGILKQRRGLRLNWHYFRFEGKFGRIGEEVRNWVAKRDDYA